MFAAKALRKKTGGGDSSHSSTAWRGRQRGHARQESLICVAPAYRSGGSCVKFHPHRSVAERMPGDAAAVNVASSHRRSVDQTPSRTGESA
ncbi:hypothetical protein ACFSHT_35845 [Paraburkholderia silviterrae]|uniref:Uncharacterized protein n=1 Tax=Paraburkholderia silviterrae TaxID=2528715 RepID=A0A4V2ZYT5_9BURK|nr:hypothetical protein [Paraburkholderia silviterrae]TDG21979.1 hypothetical protein EYW47_18990 [Paraburkholderia silviterrae]